MGANGGHMPLRVSGKNLDLGEALRLQITHRIQESVAKFYAGLVTGHVTLRPEGSGFETDCVLHLSSGVTLHAVGSAQEPYFSAERAAEKVESRLRRYKQRLKDHAPTNAAARQVEAPAYVIETPNEEWAEDEDGAFSPVVIAETKKNIKSMSVSDAVLDLDMTGAPVILFRHATSDRINLVYRRTDGNIGWVDPPSLDN
jgi:ribosomal subunit interface protein